MEKFDKAIKQLATKRGWDLSDEGSLERVQEISLQRMHIEVVSESLGRFLGLVKLDLSRNNLSSLHGLEKLFHLEKLNVYMNKLDDAREVLRLRSNEKLSSLDMRLNPLVKAKWYRYFVIQNFGERLEILDEQEILPYEIRKAREIPSLSYLDLTADDDDDDDEDEDEDEDDDEEFDKAEETRASVLDKTFSAETSKERKHSAPLGTHSPRSVKSAGTESSVSLNAGSPSKLRSGIQDSKDLNTSFIVKERLSLQNSNKRKEKEGRVEVANSQSLFSPMDAVQLAQELNPFLGSSFTNESSHGNEDDEMGDEDEDENVVDEDENVDYTVDEALLAVLKSARKLEPTLPRNEWERNLDELNDKLIQLVACRKREKVETEVVRKELEEVRSSNESLRQDIDVKIESLSIQRRRLDETAKENIALKEKLDAQREAELDSIKARVPEMLVEAHNALIEANRTLLVELGEVKARYRADEEQWRVNFERLKMLKAMDQATTATASTEGEKEAIERLGT